MFSSPAFLLTNSVLGCFTLISDLDILVVGVQFESPTWFWVLTLKIYFGVYYC